MSGSRERRWNLLLLVGTCLVLAALGEVGLRLWQRITGHVPLFTFLPAHYADRTFPNNPFLVFGPRINYQLEGKQHPELAYYNHQGFRTRDTIGPRSAGEYRIIALGGSTTEDANTVSGSHWPFTLQQALAGYGRTDVRVLNAAMAAYATGHSLVQLEFDVLQYQPSLIVLMHNINDLTVNYYAARFGRTVDQAYHVKYGRKDYTSVLSDDDVVISRLWHSVSVRVRDLVRGVPHGAIGDSIGIDDGLRAFERNLVSTVEVARAHGADVLLLTMPASRSRATYDSTRARARGGDPGYFPSFDRFIRDFEAYNAAVRRVGASVGACVVDMDALMLGHDEEYFVDVVHYSDSGSAAFGRALAIEVAPLLPAAAPPEGAGKPPDSGSGHRLRNCRGL